NATEAIEAAENPVATLLGAGWVDQWVVARRSLGQTRDHCHLRQVQLAHGLAVIHLGCGFDAVSAMPEIDLVDVKFENLVLAELALDLQGQEDLGDLAREAALAGEEEVLRHLHGDGAAAGLDLPAFQ